VRVDGLERDLPSIQPAVDLTGGERMQLTRDFDTVVELARSSRSGGLGLRGGGR
jgi:hypothetical protein